MEKSDLDINAHFVANFSHCYTSWTTVVLHSDKGDRHNIILAIESPLGYLPNFRFKPNCHALQMHYKWPEFLVSDFKSDIIRHCLWLTIHATSLSLLPALIPQDKAKKGKCLHYAELGEYINSSTAYKCTMIAFQVGSCGFIDLDSFELLISYTFEA